jgi:hypothetical protein
MDEIRGLKVGNHKVDKKIKRCRKAMRRLICTRLMRRIRITMTRLPVWVMRQSETTKLSNKK